MQGSELDTGVGGGGAVALAADAPVTVHMTKRHDARLTL